MKKLILVFILFAFVACKLAKENANEVMLTSKNEVVTNDYTIVINKIVSDSRCPEGTNCIWAGELVMELSVLQNKEIKESLELTDSMYFIKDVNHSKSYKIIIKKPVGCN